MPASHTPLPSPPHLIRSDVHIEAVLGVKRDENPRAPNLVNILDGVIPSSFRS